MLNHLFVLWYVVINEWIDDDTSFIENNTVRGLHHLTQPTLPTGRIGKLQYMKSGKLYLIANSGKKYEVSFLLYVSTHRDSFQHTFINFYLHIILSLPWLNKYCLQYD